MNLKLAFHGGAGTVTGSRHLLTAGRRRLLVDAGLFQGLKALRLLNWQRPAFDPLSVSDVLLTHAHIDHCGYLPRLAREGFGGKVHCTRATHELAPVLLMDSAKLQEEDAEYANRKGFSKHRPALPLYDTQDVTRAMRHFRATDYGDVLELGDGITARFLNSGHVLGSAFIDVRVELGGRETRIVFSGDVGRYGVPLHTDPEPLPACDVLVLESTYGGRLHDRTPLIGQIRRPFRETLARGGTILVPSFALARVQLVTLMLRELMESGDIPDVPVHIDSPMATEVTQIYHRHLGSGDLDKELTEGEWQRLFPREVHFHSSVEESKRINALGGRRIIIASSGMLTGGRVLHHLERLLPHEENLIVLAGYQAAGTRGRALTDGAATLRMHGKDIPVRAEVMAMHGLSAHGDANELLRWVASGGAEPKMVYVTHGEPEAASALAARLEGELHLRATVPRMGQEFDLGAL